VHTGRGGPRRAEVRSPSGLLVRQCSTQVAGITSFNVFGGGGGFVYNVTPVIGIRADFMGYTQSSGHKVTENGQVVGNVSGNLFTYLFGLQFKKHNGKMQPFGNALFGAAHTNLYTNICNLEGGCGSGSQNNNGFSMQYGLGLDVPITKSVQFRPVEVDYLYTHFGSNHIPNASSSQNNFKYVVGLNFTFGGQ
jgi:opacity protein-like surface antigen